jgi:hypothetical protein
LIPNHSRCQVQLSDTPQLHHHLQEAAQALCNLPWTLVVPELLLLQLHQHQELLQRSHLFIIAKNVANQVLMQLAKHLGVLVQRMFLSARINVKTVTELIVWEETLMLISGGKLRGVIITKMVFTLLVETQSYNTCTNTKTICIELRLIDLDI